MRYIALLLAASLALAGCGATPAAQPTQPAAPTARVAASSGPIEVRDAWVRPAAMAAAEPTAAMDVPTPAGEASGGMGGMGGADMGAVSGAYMTIHNSGAAADRLIRAASDVAASVELHTMIDSGGVMQMRPVEAVDVPAGGDAVLKPGGFHVMLIGLRRDLSVGDTVHLTLTFEKAGAVEVDATVQAPPAQ